MEHDKTREVGEKTQPYLFDDLRTLSKDRPNFGPNWGMRLALTNLSAGADTTSWTPAAFIVGVGQNPNVAAKPRQELDAAVEEGRTSKSLPVPFDETTRRPYLRACLQECLRLWPNVAISLPRDVPPEGIEIDGHFIPEGYTVGMNSRVLGLNQETFGAEPAKFRPERCIEADKTRRDAMENRNLSFGGPRRKCPGIHGKSKPLFEGGFVSSLTLILLDTVAMFCMSKVLATLSLNFDTKLLNELDGAPGPGKHIWRELGSLPT